MEPKPPKTPKTLPPLSAEARSIVERLDLLPHPEGGYYREVYRDVQSVIRQESSRGLSLPRLKKEGEEIDPDGALRSAVTVILFLIPRGQPTAWHRVDSTEIWHHVGGAPICLEIEESDKGEKARRTLHIGTLGHQGTGGDADSIVGVVPAGAWQRARSEGEHSLATCTVAPGFEFSDFTLREPDHTT
ncbi:MAG: cupin domain-containing protein [Leptospirillia bacterium]